MYKSRKKYKAAAAAAMISVLLLLSCCGGKVDQGAADKGYTADLYAYVATHKGDDALKYKSTLSDTDIYTIGIHVPKTASDAADSFLSLLVKSCVNDFKNSISTAEQTEDTGKGILYGDYTVNQTEKYTSILMNFNIRIPGNDPVTEYYSVCYTNSDGALITFGDLVGSTYLSPVSDLLIKSFQNDEDYSQHLSDTFLTDLSMTSASAASFTVGDGITVYFNANTVLPDYGSAITLHYTTEEFLPCFADGIYIRLFDDSGNLS